MQVSVIFNVDLLAISRLYSMVCSMEIQTTAKNHEQ